MILPTWVHFFCWLGQRGITRSIPRGMPDTPCLKRLGYNMKSRERDRRLTLEELDKVLKHFFEMLARHPTFIHMPKVVAFAIISTRRMDEIARII